MDERSAYALTPDELRRRFERALDLECDLDPMILRARQLIEQMGDQLPPAERAEAYRQLAAAPSYRSQRDNAKDPDSTCNFTSQAMAFETLGVNYHEVERGKQADVVVLDPAKLSSNLGAPVEHTDDRVGHMRVVKRSDGVVKHVVVNGKTAFSDGAFAGGLGREKFGRLLRRK